MKRDSFTVCEAYRMSENWMNRCDSFPPHRICTFCMQILGMYAFMQGSFREFDEDSFISFISDVKKSGCVCSAPLQKDAFTCSKSLFFLSLSYPRDQASAVHPSEASLQGVKFHFIHFCLQLLQFLPLQPEFFHQALHPSTLVQEQR